MFNMIRVLRKTEELTRQLDSISSHTSVATPLAFLLSFLGYHFVAAIVVSD